MYLIQYNTFKLLKFNQNESFDFKNINKKFKSQSSLRNTNENIKSACLGIVYVFIIFFEKYNNISTYNFYINLKNEFTDPEKLKSMESKIYYWFSLEVMLRNKNKYYGINDKLLNILKKDAGILNNTPFNYSQLLIKLVIKTPQNKWSYIECINGLSEQKKLENLISLYSDMVVKNINSIVCFSITLEFNNSAHQVCIMITNESKNKYLFFDPNFGLYSFENTSIFFTFLIDINSYYNNLFQFKYYFLDILLKS